MKSRKHYYPLFVVDGVYVKTPSYTNIKYT